MKSQKILIVGSANASCSDEKIKKAHEFVKAITEEIIVAGHCVAVLAMGEPTKSGSGQHLPLTFDWETLRTVENHTARIGYNKEKPYAYAFMRTDAMQTKVNENNRILISKLQSQNALEVHHIETDLYSGGEYRDWQTEKCQAMVAIGGGKGTYQIGNKMLEARKPVMPMDINLGGYNADGKGAVQLLEEMKSDTRTFLPRNHELVSKKLYSLSLENPYWSTERVAHAVAAIIADEIENAEEPKNSPWIKRGRDLIKKMLPITQGTYYGTKSTEAILDIFQ